MRRKHYHVIEETLPDAETRERARLATYGRYPWMSEARKALTQRRAFYRAAGHHMRGTNVYGIRVRPAEGEEFVARVRGCWCEEKEHER